MPHHNTLLHGLLKLVPWGSFDQLVTTFDADKGVSVLTTKSQLVALLHGQLSGASGLRELVTTFSCHSSKLYHLGVTAPKRSTLSDANRDRPADLFVALFEILLRQATAGLRRATREAIRLIDSTSLPLSPLSRDWAFYEAHNAGAKLHVVFDPHAAVPVHFAVTAQRVNDLKAAKAMPIEARATYVFDLGYYDFGWWAKLMAMGCIFVTRLKTYTPTRIIEEREIAPGNRTRVVADRIVRLPDRLKGHREHPLACDLREIHVVIDTGKTLRILSNDLLSSAETIADLYKTRWQIELFFRWVKQTLRIRKFFGTSENAVRIQIAVALIAYLLLLMAKTNQSGIESPLEFARLTRANLMHRISISQLAQPKPPPEHSENQLSFTLT